VGFCTPDLAIGLFMLTLAGFILLVSACGTDACDALPVTEDIYLNKQSCDWSQKSFMSANLMRN
jgi:hypothetical protein